MAAGKPEVANPKKAVVSLSTTDLAIDHYIAVMTDGQSAGVEQLFTEDFSQKVQASEKTLKIEHEKQKFAFKKISAILSRNNNGQTLDIQTSKNCF